jgi:hypothetical protein
MENRNLNISRSSSASASSPLVKSISYVNSEKNIPTSTYDKNNSEKDLLSELNEQSLVDLMNLPSLPPKSESINISNLDMPISPPNILTPNTLGTSPSSSSSLFQLLDVSTSMTPIQSPDIEKVTINQVKLDNNPIQSQQQSSSHALPLPVPLNITTQEFGEYWSETQPINKNTKNPPITKNIEMKQSSRCNVKSLQQLRMIMSKGYYSHIESISATMEAIFASSLVNGITGHNGNGSTGMSLLGTGSNGHNGNGYTESSKGNISGVLLIHIKLQLMKSSCEVTVRSPSRDICTDTIQHIKSILSS